MKKTQYKYTKILVATLVGIFFLSISVHVLVNAVGLGGDIVSLRSGSFINATQDRTESGWYLSATEANGSNTFFVELSQYELENIYLISSIAYGEMVLAIVQEGHTKYFDLTDHTGRKFLGNYIAYYFVPGRLDMRLSFTHAENISVTASWQY